MSFCSYNESSFLHYIDENKFFTCLTTFTFLVVGFFIYVLNRYTFFEKRKIPRAVRPTAPFGNIQNVLFQNTTLYTYLWQYSNKFKRKKIRFGGLYLFFKPIVLVVDPGVQKKFFEGKTLRDVYRRKFVAALEEKIVGLFDDEALKHFLVKYKFIRNNLVVDVDANNISTVVHNFFMETSCAAFGFKSSVEIVDVVNALLAEKTSSGFKHYFYVTYPFFKRNKSTRQLQTLINNIVGYRKKNDVKENDLIDGFSSLINDGEFSVEEIVAELFDSFVYNIIYGCSTVLFCLYELASNCDIQEDLIGEVRRFNKENVCITLENLRQMGYLDAVVKETLRKYPPVPLVIKECTEDYKLVEFALDLPKGCFMAASVLGIQYDAANFADPQVFNPDRFSEENVTFIKPDTYIPFGTDFRKEIGLGFTTVHVKLCLINILSSFKVSLSKNTTTLEFDNKKVTVCPNKLPLQFQPL